MFFIILYFYDFDTRKNLLPIPAKVESPAERSPTDRLAVSTALRLRVGPARTTDPHGIKPGVRFGKPVKS